MFGEKGHTAGATGERDPIDIRSNYVIGAVGDVDWKLKLMEKKLYD